MRSLAADGMTMLIVTHEIEFARTVSNRIVFMEDGRIVETGETKRIFTHPEKERTAAFLKLQETLSKEEEQP
jgi:ABC-type polar amino acid transport system ATPase subunit